ncbi:protein vav-like [Contarinia nasturtii]|uniref:protein vav-like n=1 Tax=Contarinia nasturtii TaxID=265458 RepID=UPI0012D49E40|nr:protein vav-like [Contarinia nasturtii]
MASNLSDDLWRECVDWLTRCKAIPSDHKANWKDSEIRVLALTLRDGVILCNLLNSIDPNALDMKDFNRKPQMAQFLCCQNIKLFLDTCKNYYGLRESDLFEPTMLYNLTNFHRVLITLSKLSRRVAQIHPHLPGFSIQVSPSERSDSSEDIYKDLHSTNNHHAKMSDKCAEKSETNGTRLANNEDARTTSVDNNECDSSGSSLVADDEQASSSLNSSTEENQEELENHLNNGGSSTVATIKITEPPLGSDWYLYCDDDFTNVSLIEEKIYEDLCYVTFSKKPEVVCQTQVTPVTIWHN